jgi:hypothetical protein
VSRHHDTFDRSAFFQHVDAAANFELDAFEESARNIRWPMVMR